MRYKEKHQIVLDNCDGYSYVSDKDTEEDYKRFYHWIEKDDKILFPFIYNVIAKFDDYVERCIIFVPKKRFIQIVDGRKITISVYK
jgi:hypothetical protein